MPKGPCAAACVQLGFGPPAKRGGSSRRGGKPGKRGKGFEVQFGLQGHCVPQELGWAGAAAPGPQRSKKRGTPLHASNQGTQSTPGSQADCDRSAARILACAKATHDCGLCAFPV